jgi:hypothetical protein
MQPRAHDLAEYEGVGRGEINRLTVGLRRCRGKSKPKPRGQKPAQLAA